MARSRRRKKKPPIQERVGEGVDPEAFVARDIKSVERMLEGAREHLKGRRPWRAIQWWGDGMEALGMAERTCGEFQPVDGCDRIYDLKDELLSLSDEIMQYFGAPPGSDELEERLEDMEPEEREAEIRRIKRTLLAAAYGETPSKDKPS